VGAAVTKEVSGRSASASGRPAENLGLLPVLEAVAVRAHRDLSSCCSCSALSLESWLC